jgi:hypothetical protein
LKATSAPRGKLTAIARLMPRVAPVTIAALPENILFVSLKLFSPQRQMLDTMDGGTRTRETPSFKP